ncbi:MAG: glycosyltransferase family 4 protein, partial [Cyanobacteria bacterium J06648_11]
GSADSGQVYRHAETVSNGQIIVHRYGVAHREDFVERVGAAFADRHAQIDFDVLEGPDCGAEAAAAIRHVPAMPLVVKLHTPQYLLNELGKVPLSWPAKTRMALGALRRGQRPKRLSVYCPETDPEWQHAHSADRVAAPSMAIGQRIITDWKISPERVVPVPYPYIPSSALLSIPVETQTHRVTFIGRLEVRKGILDLAQAIPRVLRRYPETQFRFVGPAWPSPISGLDMQQYLEQRLARHRNVLTFTGGVALTEIPNYLADTDICVFPSIWESFGLVCTEAMAAARGIVGSAAGGMAELLDGGHCGHLVAPRRPRQIAAAIINLLNHPEQRMELGKRARERVRSHYSLDAIAQRQEETYRQAIEHRRKQGSRREQTLPTAT